MWNASPEMGKLKIGPCGPELVWQLKVSVWTTNMIIVTQISNKSRFCEAQSILNLEVTYRISSKYATECQDLFLKGCHI